MPVCPHCGHDTPDDEARFCAACGKPLSGEGAAETTSVLHLSSGDATDVEAEVVVSDADAGVVERLAEGTAMLVVRRGPASGARFLLDADVTSAGRHPDSDIFLDDITVSRHHVEFRRGPEGFTIRDLGSLNGTYVNRSRISSCRPTADPSP